MDEYAPVEAILPVLSDLAETPIGSVPTLSRERRFTLHAMISRVGHSRENDHGYSWDGLNRGEREFAVFQLTLAGEGALRWNDNNYALRRGDAFVVRVPQNHHYYLPQHSDSWEFLYIVLYGMEVIRIIRNIHSINGPVLQLSPESRLPGLMKRIVRYAWEETDPSGLDLSRYAYEFVMRLSREVLLHSPELKVVPAIKQARDFARNNFERDIGVEDMAHAASMSRSHFSRLFSQAEGVAPREYLEHLRIRHAMSLLGQSELTIKEVAGASGFRDANYFSRKFRRIAGVTASEYRNNGT